MKLPSLLSSICNKKGSTPIMLAANNGHKDVILILIQRGANLDLVNADGLSALHYASSSGHTDVVEILLNHNVDIDVVTKDGSTPVMLAANNGHKDVILILIQRGANIDLIDEDGWLALHFASSRDHTDIVETLLNHNVDIDLVNKDGNTALHIACKEGHINVIQCLLSQGADMTIKNIEGKTPLDGCCGTNKDEIFSLFSKYNPKRVLDDVSIWIIEYLNEEQVFEKPDYGVKFVVPPSSVELGQSVKTKVQVVALEESEIILPPDVEPVSCFYKIEITGKFFRPIELHIQHNVKLTSQEESQQLAFIKAKEPPPYKFELVPTDINQEFKPYDNSGVIKPFHFCVFAGVKRKHEDFFCEQLSSSYAMTVFLKRVCNSIWMIQAVITKDLGPFLKRVNTEEVFKDWKKFAQISFDFDPKDNKVTYSQDNDYYDIEPLRKPCQVTKEAVDKSSPDTTLHFLKFKATLKVEQKLSDLTLTFKGMRDEDILIITSHELQLMQNQYDKIFESPSSSVFNHVESLSEDLLCKEPKKKHLTQLLHKIRHMWEIIGEQLDVEDDDIMSIKLAHSNVSYANTIKLSEVLQVWIDKITCEVSWRMIITVINNPPVEAKRVADEIRTFLARPEIRNDYLPSDQPGQVFTTFNCTPPVTPKSTEIKVEVDEMEQEAPSQSSNPLD